MDESQFDASSEPDPESRLSKAGDGSPGRTCRPFLGIRFQCCKTYGRIYRSEDQSQYVGQCPKCRARVTVPIGTGGTSSRFFNAS